MKLASVVVITAVLAFMLAVSSQAQWFSNGHYETGTIAGTTWESWSNVEDHTNATPGPTPGPGYGFRYESIVQYADVDPHILGWDYEWYIENNSTEYKIEKWEWTHQSYWNSVTQSWESYLTTYSGNILAVSPDPTLPGGFRDWQSGNELALPLPVSPPNAYAKKWISEYVQFYPVSPVTVLSTITWTDSLNNTVHTEDWYIFVPLDLVPEPGTFVSLVASMGVLSVLARRRN